MIKWHLNCIRLCIFQALRSLHKCCVVSLAGNFVPLCLFIPMCINGTSEPLEKPGKVLTRCNPVVGSTSSLGVVGGME